MEQQSKKNSSTVVCSQRTIVTMERPEKVTPTSPNVSVPADAAAGEGLRSAKELTREAGLVHDRFSFRIPTNEDAKIHVHNTHTAES
jgi:hypothetical protein